MARLRVVLLSLLAGCGLLAQVRREPTPEFDARAVAKAVLLALGPHERVWVSSLTPASNGTFWLVGRRLSPRPRFLPPFVRCIRADGTYVSEPIMFGSCPDTRDTESASVLGTTGDNRLLLSITYTSQADRPQHAFACITENGVAWVSDRWYHWDVSDHTSLTHADGSILVWAGSGWSQAAFRVGVGCESMPRPFALRKRGQQKGTWPALETILLDAGGECSALAWAGDSSLVVARHNPRLESTVSLYRIDANTFNTLDSARIEPVDATNYVFEDDRQWDMQIDATSGGHLLQLPVREPFKNERGGDVWRPTGSVRVIGLNHDLEPTGPGRVDTIPNWEPRHQWLGSGTKVRVTNMLPDRRPMTDSDTVYTHAHIGFEFRCTGPDGFIYREEVEDSVPVAWYWPVERLMHVPEKKLP